MTQKVIHRTFAGFKKLLPEFITNPVRSLATAILAPVTSNYETGFFLSCFKRCAVSKDGKPLPWYTYPSIEFLKHRTYEDKILLEFGGGQSTLWWASRAKRIVTLEGDQQWYDRIKNTMPNNVDLCYVPMTNKIANAAEVNRVMSSRSSSPFDVIVIDGLDRAVAAEFACNHLAKDGIIICDNSDVYNINGCFKGRGLDRVDFYGNSPGVVLPSCTSIYFKGSSFVFDSTIPMPLFANG